MELVDKVVVITGASRGFGLALAKLFRQEHCRVIISSNDRTELERAAGDLGLDYFVADVAAPEQLNDLGRYVADKYGVVDIWINNAGIQIAPSLTEVVDTNKLKQLFAVNFFGYFYGCQTALRLMKKQGRGLIININSTAGLGGKADLSAYVSSKFAVRGLTETIRQEIAGTAINIYSVHPGGMQTDIYQEQYPADFKEYMSVDKVAALVITNLKSAAPEADLVIRRPVAQ
ncbi:MAG: SDR family oxidoreductase [Patescibacteria group bacterium]